MQETDSSQVTTALPGPTSAAEVQSLVSHYSLSGAPGAPLLVLLHAIGADFSMWDVQMPLLESQFRVLRYDIRGHGGSVLKSGHYATGTTEQLGRDLIDLLDDLRLDQVHFCGLSLGGTIGMWLAVHAPSRLGKLVLCNSSARIGTTEFWNTRIQKVREGGMGAIADASIERWFTSRFRVGSPKALAHIKEVFLKTPPGGYIACCEAIRDTDQRDSIRDIRVPTLIIAGAHDPATPPQDGKYLAENIPSAKYVEVDAAHISNIEADGQFTQEVLGFLT